eukprot:GHVN01096373.1.p1 GENE.GHVN01096373.1~~GHVN01096373.1.p1  ORF type:complete len:196 (-),score=26.54 GHVN01096373.1:652-1239(-)
MEIRTFGFHHCENSCFSFVFLLAGWTLLLSCNMPRSKKPSARVASSTTAEPKLSNTQLKKAARKEMAFAQSDKMKKLERAEAVTDVTSLLPDVFKYFKKSDPPVVVEGYAACDVPQTLMEACFALTKANMQPLYDRAEFNNRGWSDKIKMKELTHDEARFIIAKTANDGELSGFAHFRFEPDEETGVSRGGTKQK